MSCTIFIGWQLQGQPSPSGIKKPGNDPFYGSNQGLNKIVFSHSHLQCVFTIGVEIGGIASKSCLSTSNQVFVSRFLIQITVLPQEASSILLPNRNEIHENFYLISYYRLQLFQAFSSMKALYILAFLVQILSSCLSFIKFQAFSYIKLLILHQVSFI